MNGSVARVEIFERSILTTVVSVDTGSTFFLGVWNDKGVRIALGRWLMQLFGLQYVRWFGGEEGCHAHGCGANAVKNFARDFFCGM